MAIIKIGNRVIGDGYPPLVIAEIGINHGGSLDLAIQMADAAIDAGAEMIKHQTHVIEDEMSEEAKRLEVPKSALFNVDDHIRVTPKLPATLKHIRNKSNLFMSEAESWEGDVISGIIFLRGEYRKIIIHPRCEEVIQNMNGYWWERDAKEDKILSEPIDMYNEYINAIRYALYKRIKGAI